MEENVSDDGDTDQEEVESMNEGQLSVLRCQKFRKERSKKLRLSQSKRRQSRKDRQDQPRLKEISDEVTLAAVYGK